MFDIILILANYLHSKLIQYIVTFISSFFCALCNRKRIANIVVMALIAKAYQNMKHYHTTSLLLQWLSSLPSRLTQNGNNEKSLYRIITFYIFTTKFFMKSFTPLPFLNIRYTDTMKYT